MPQKSNLITHTIIMTAVNLIMKSAGVSFNAYLTSKIGADGIGLFQLVMSVYSMAVTFSCAGIRLASTRITVEINTLRKNDLNKSLTMCVTYAGICGSLIGFALFVFSDIISTAWISEPQTAFSLRILSLSLPFVAMSSALGGFFTATERIPQYSAVQMLEQGFKIVTVIFLINRFSCYSASYACMAIVSGMTASEIFSFALSTLLKRIFAPRKTQMPVVDILRMLRVALPDAAGTCVRSVLLTIEHLLIPKGFKKSGADSASALAAYGNIHAMAMPILLYPSAVLSSLSSLLVPDLAKKSEAGDRQGINQSVSITLKKTFAFSVISAVACAAFAPVISEIIYKSREAVMYIRILSPLVPVMYMDMITDGMLKGLDQQVYSMRCNIIDSALCVAMVYFLIPEYSVKGYIFILYASEIINFYLSFGRLIKICDLKIKPSQELSADNSRLSRLKKYSAFHEVCECQTYRGRTKHSQVPLFFRRKDRTQDLHVLR